MREDSNDLIHGETEGQRFQVLVLVQVQGRNKEMNDSFKQLRRLRETMALFYEGHYDSTIAAVSFPSLVPHISNKSLFSAALTVGSYSVRLRLRGALIMPNGNCSLAKINRVT